MKCPYSNSEEEREEGVDLTKKLTVGQEELTSPTPKEDQDEQRPETSIRKPRSQRVNKLLEVIHELEVLDREIKRNNDILNKRNK